MYAVVLFPILFVLGQLYLFNFYCLSSGSLREGAEKVVYSDLCLTNREFAFSAFFCFYINLHSLWQVIFFSSTSSEILID